MKKILLATDGSSCSLEAGRKTQEFLEAWPQAELIVLHVIPPMSYSFDTTVILPEIEASEKAEIEEGRQTFEAQFGDQPRARFVSSHGLPAEVICDLASRENVDLIIVGSHGKGSVKRALLGSVSQAVVHHAGRPVLVVRGFKPT